MKSIQTVMQQDGTMQIFMQPDSGLEVMILEAMATRVEAKPAAITMTYRDGVATVSVSAK